jgi:hypothetical protein
MRKDNFKGRDLSENIIEEYEVEIKGEDSHEFEDLKRKYESGNYILLWKSNSKLENPFNEDSVWTLCDIWVDKDYWDFKLIHNKHKDILEAYLKNPSVEIETGMFASMTGEIEPSKWVMLEKDFIEDYNEEFWYRLKVKDLAWYEDENMVGKLLKAENSQTNLNEICIFKHKGDNTITTIGLDGKEFIGFFSIFRPATEDEVLSLVHEKQQKISKETTNEPVRRAKMDTLLEIYNNLGTLKWAGADESWDTAIETVRDDLFNKIKKSLRKTDKIDLEQPATIYYTDR